MIRLSIFCTTLFTNNDIKVVIQMHAFLFDRENCDAPFFLEEVRKKTNDKTIVLNQ